MKNAVLLVTYNNLALTKEAVDSVMAQDIEGGVELWFVDNGSTDGTFEWIWEYQPSGQNDIVISRYQENTSPVKVVNHFTEQIFRANHKRFLGVPNDVVLPPNLYRELDRWPRGIVTASQTDTKLFPRFETATAVNTCTPMAVGLIRKWAHDALVAKDGYFMDEGMWHYASDCDMALRMAACGITGVQLDIQYYHFCSASHRLATKEDGDRMRTQADRDREYFKKKWGFNVSDREYGEHCGNINFKG